MRNNIVYIFLIFFCSCSKINPTEIDKLKAFNDKYFIPNLSLSEIDLMLKKLNEKEIETNFLIYGITCSRKIYVKKNKILAQVIRIPLDSLSFIYLSSDLEDNNIYLLYYINRYITPTRLKFNDSNSIVEKKLNIIFKNDSLNYCLENILSKAKYTIY